MPTHNQVLKDAQRSHLLHETRWRMCRECRELFMLADLVLCVDCDYHHCRRCAERIGCRGQAAHEVKGDAPARPGE